MAGIYRKVTLRFLPFLFICYLFNYFDRVNVGFAKLQMLDDLKLSETVYGLGAGIFFIGYFMFGIPSNLALHKFGARRWIAIIMVIWGSFSTAMLFTHSATSFYILRFFTGVAEAGFFPGIVLYFTMWYPAAQRGRIMALFMSAIPVSGIIGGPLSGWILDYFSAGHANMAGWQWLFLLQGLPTVFLGLAVPFILDDSVASAKWLNKDEKALLANDIRQDEKQKETTGKESFTSAFANGRVWLLAVVYFCIQMGVYAISFWLPSIIKSIGFQSPMAIGWLSSLPYIAAGIAMIAVGRSADAKRERRWHLIFPMVFGASGLIISSLFAQDAIIAMIGLTIATAGILTALPMFWPMPSAFLGTVAAAGGLALINSMGNLAGFASPYLVGWLKDATQSTNLALYLLAGVLCLGAVLVTQVSAKAVNR